MADILSGKLSQPGVVSGKLCTTPAYEPYEGEYAVTPGVGVQTLKTAHKVLKENIEIAAVPYHETSNEHNGITVHIAEEV